MKRTSAFTLIELLVVVAIVTVLAGLLVPALTLAKTAAQRSRCATNLRQIGMGLLNYSDDNEGIWIGPQWQALLNPYLNDGGSTRPSFGICPAAPSTNIVQGVLGVTYAMTGVGWNTGTNVTFYSPNAPPLPIARIRAPSGRCALTEHWSNTPGSKPWGSNTHNDQYVRRLHGDSANFWFADGHVQSLPVTGVEFRQEVQWLFDPMFWTNWSSTSARLR